MKKPFPIAAFLIGTLLMVSCEDPLAPDSLVSSEPEIIISSEKLYFSTFPQSRESVKFLFSPLEGQNSLKRIILLGKDSDTLATAPIVASSFHQWTLVGELEFDFQEGESYQLLVDQQVNRDSLYRFQLPDYRHVFAEHAENNLLAQFERLYTFDLSPDREFLFLKDFKSNIQSNHRLELSTGSLLKLDDDLGLKFRAVDKNKLVYVGSGIYESEIQLYDVEDKSSVPFGTTTQNGGSITRVVDGHLVYTNPVKDGERTITIVDLETDERRVVPDFAFGYRIRENIIGQLIFGNSLFHIDSGTLTEELSPFQGTALLQYLPEENFVFYMQGLGPEFFDSGYSSKLIAGKRGEQPAFDSGIEKSVTYFLPSETRIVDNKFLFYKAYGPNRDEHRVSGFYQADLSTGRVQLVESESRLNVYPDGLVQLADNLWLTIFSGEVALYQLK